MTVVAIHQPNFFPWLGFFSKMVKCDRFIFLDNVQFPKKGGSWINRVKFIVSGESSWVTIPVCRNYHGVLPVSEIQIDERRFLNWRKTFFRTLSFSYGKHPFFNEVMQLMVECFEYDGNKLSELNIRSIKKVLDYIGFSYEHTIVGTTMEHSGQATELLISMTKAAGGDAYMCGGGAGGYQADEMFESAGIKLIYQNFRHPVYEQKGRSEFLPGLSILDALFNCSATQVKGMLKRSEAVS